MKANEQPKAIFLKDYRQPDYWTRTVRLEFNLREDYTEVRSILTIERNRASSNDQTPVLELAGCELITRSVSIDGRELDDAEYIQSEENLNIPNAPDNFELVIVTHITPAQNTALEGLYQSNGMYCTQCEAEGFRRITWFQDRPDVMATYTTRIEADKTSFPVMLSNGNKINSGDADNGRHWVEWHDPFPKPSYLFALVAGDLAVQEDYFTTASGREVHLQLFVEPQNIDKCEHALVSLKKAMHWDEEVYGREYDLDVFMIVAVDHFNMGAMENKGLNVFNSACVLARSDTATDADYENIEGIIGHEYFHNWSGNRVTCRDWFQLSLKEGFTVFRDQEFSADMTSEPVKRISEVNVLRTAQFREDSGPMAHPIRPDSFIDISNFYTVTIYNKGAEVVRMLYHLLGATGFRKGTDLYFSRHDGQAVTTEDFVKALEDANERDFSQFKRWYNQAGTPEITVERQYDAASKTYVLTFSQHTPATPGQESKQPFHIPVAMGLVSHDGKVLETTSDFDDKSRAHRVLELTEQSQSFTFHNVEAEPVPSLLRGFSAPVRIKLDFSNDELISLMKHDHDQFNRWEAGQKLTTRVLLDMIEANKTQQDYTVDEAVMSAFSHVLTDKHLDHALIAQALSLPNESILADEQEVVDPQATHLARRQLTLRIAEFMEQGFVNRFKTLNTGGEYVYNAYAMGERALKNLSLHYLTRLDNADYHDMAWRQFEAAHNMTDVMAALGAMVNTDCRQREVALADFYAKWKHDNLVVDKWLSIQARSEMPGVLDHIIALSQHEAFDIKNPNKVRAVIGGIAFGNAAAFHDASGRGYEFVCDKTIQLAHLNPQIAARIAGAFAHWRRFDADRQKMMQDCLRRIEAEKDLPKDVYEVVARSLGEI